MKEYLKSTADVFEEIDSSANGLTSEDAQKRLEKNGKNKLAEAKKPSVIKKFFVKFRNLFIVFSAVSFCNLL